MFDDGKSAKSINTTCAFKENSSRTESVLCAYCFGTSFAHQGFNGGSWGFGSNSAHAKKAVPNIHSQSRIRNSFEDKGGEIVIELIAFE